MSQSFDRVRAELESLGLKTIEFDSPHGRVVAFDYEIQVGSYKGERVQVGVSFQAQDEGYPEYPPHWVHVSPPINDGKGGAVESYSADGRDWIAMSRPPGDFWSELLTKHMHNYISEHLRRIWSDV